MIDGRQLIEWGMRPGKHFASALDAANAAIARGDDPRAAAFACVPVQQRLQAPHAVPHGEFMEADGEAEALNIEKVRATIAEVSRTPRVVGTAVMPDACPSGPPGVIPVGGVVASKAIHPGMHSADICCSVAISVFGDVDPKAVLDRAQAVTHFGGGGRDETVQPPAEVMAPFLGKNPFLKDLETGAVQHFATQGDGNHFLFVGRLRSSGEVAMVTHHGSRKPGAMLYKRGMAAAETVRKVVSPETPKNNAWIEFDTREGEDYWAALQAIRAWTKANHFAIHEMVAEGIGPVRDRFWNEHNFVFRRGDTFLHGKGATPAWGDFADDSQGLVLIPLNMGAPVLIARGLDRSDALGFCPHGAGRNVSRTAHLKALAGREDDPGVDVRWFSGVPDASELPSAYKRADAIEAQISRFGLAEIVDHVDPYGSIMAGDWQVNAPWRKKRERAVA